MSKLLIHADDDPRIRESMQVYMEMAFPNVSVEEVEDGTELVKRVKIAPPDAILTDNTMVQMHGLTAIKQIRDLKIGIPIGMMTGENVEREAYAAGADYFIPKPDFERLSLFLIKYLGQ